VEIPGQFSVKINILCTVSGPVRAQDALPELNPLVLADTSSPRATLKAFFVLSDDLKRSWEAGQADRVYALSTGLRELMDFSATPYGANYSQQINRVLMMRAILDRIELPLFGDVPGAEEVAASDLTVWQIPGTRIRIERQTLGRQTGEFLFSAGTLEELDLMYRRVESRPYKPGKEAFYEFYLKTTRGVISRVDERSVVSRLRDIDTSSPRSTLLGFLNNVNAAYRIAMDAEAALAADPPTMTHDEAVTADLRAKGHIERAASALDLSQIPEGLHADLGLERVLHLKEVLDRTLLPPIRSVPGRKDVLTSGSQTEPFVFQLQGTPIRIARVLDGERAGAFLFAPRTVSEIDNAYDRLKDLPYRNVTLTREWDYGDSIRVTPNFHNFYISTAGNFVPSTNTISQIVSGLPKSFHRLYWDQTLWQWIGLVLLLAATAVAVYLIFWGTHKTTRRLDPVYSAWATITSPLICAAVLWRAERFAGEDIGASGHVLLAYSTVLEIAILAMLAWAIWRLGMALAETIVATPRISDGGIDASMIRIIAGILSMIASIGVLVAGLRALGVDAIPLIAGLGVGGLAVALAIRPTLENLISGLILYTDRPVRVGDFCSFGDKTGTIENIGVRSTQIRGLDRTLISIPNAKFSDMEIINWARCDKMLISTVIGLRYETSQDQLRFVLARMREMLHAHPKIDRSTVRVRFSGYGASSLDITLRVYALTREWNEYHAIREDIYLRINDIVEGAGTSFAFPSQTLYMGRDDGLDEDLSEKAEEAVETWRKESRFPFPRLSEKRMDELEASIDYPPRGSFENRTLEETEESAEPLSADNTETEKK